MGIQIPNMFDIQMVQTDLFEEWFRFQLSSIWIPFVFSIQMIWIPNNFLLGMHTNTDFECSVFGCPLYYISWIHLLHRNDKKAGFQHSDIYFPNPVQP